MHQKRQLDLLALALAYHASPVPHRPQYGHITRPALSGTAKARSPGASTIGTSGAIRAGSLSMSKGLLHAGHACGQRFTVSVFTAITLLDMMGVRWPQPVT